MKIANIHRFCVSALLLAGPLALAQATVTMGSATPVGKQSAACCQLTTTLANEAIRPQDIPGDEQFFLTEGAPPNIHFLIDTSGSMQEFPQIDASDHDTFFKKGDTNAADPTHTGCNNTDLLATESSRSWDYTKVYPVPDEGTGLGSDTGHPDLFRDDKVYLYMSWGDSSSPAPAWADQDSACKWEYPLFASTQATQYNNCKKCLLQKGFFKKPGVNDYGTWDSSSSISSPGTILSNAGKSKSGQVETRPYFIFTGRFLNFNPPKYVTAKVVLKQVIKDLKRVRTGMSQFNWDGSDSSNNGADLMRGQDPSCDQIIKNSSSFDSNRASFIQSVDGLTFRTGTPLAKALLNIGQYFSSSDSIFTTKFGFTDYKPRISNGSLTSEGRSICWGCQVSSVIIVTDGTPSDNDRLPSKTWAAVQKLNGNTLVKCPTASDCQYASDNADYQLDDVAKMLATQDLQQTTPPQASKDFNTAGKQSLSIYTVGFGVDTPVLRNAAEVGNGAYYTARDAQGLKDAILTIIQAVQTRATSFSSTAVASLQIKNESGTLVPRFKPSKAVVNPWEGFLYRFNRIPEVLANCVKDPKTGTTNAGDLNQDGDCEDVVMVDTTGKAVIEDDDGNFVHLDDTSVLATPFWEAGEAMRPAAAVKPATWDETKTATARQIFTIIDENGDGKIDSNDTPIAFTEANAAKLQDYMGISNNPLECDALRVQLGLATLTPLECTKLVIRYYRGADVLNPDPTLRAYDRDFLLNDIFHSSPVSVEPPTPKFFCGYSNQCLNSLFSGKTPRTATYDAGGGLKRDAYDEFVARYGNRDKIVLVGSNGGMLHAFQNGVVDKPDPLTGLYDYTAGTGKELWAFIPPDLLPKLRMKLGKHGYFVDGSAMVRDVWLDGLTKTISYTDKPGQKDVEEYRTVAVVGTGSGGVHRFALDLTGLIASPNVSTQKTGRVPNKKGDFLWMWPQPCDKLALQLGESYSNFAPKPPPIGPVAMEDSTGPWEFSTNPSKPVVKAREQWVVMLNGGYDPYMVRGRGMAVVDLKTGDTLWSFFNGDGKQFNQNLRYPISAGVAMMDLGNALNSSGDADLLFDTATLPDFGGQVWTLRFWLPGHIDPTTKQVDNWYAARAFHVALDASQKGDDTIARPAFSYITTNTIQPDTGYVRTYVGTGDRYHLADTGSQCSLGNPRACALQGCHVKEDIVIERNGVKSADMDTEFEGVKFKGDAPNVPGTGDACLAPKVTLKWEITKGGTCTAENNNSVVYGCTGNSTAWSCSTTNGWVQINSTNAAPAVSSNRFYGFWSYGVDPTRRFNAGTEAISYDDARIRDSDLVNVGDFNADGTVKAAQNEAGSLSKGWYINYVAGSERTATAATVLDGCVIWNTMEPSGAAGAVCATTGSNLGRIYQANFVSGKADCAAAFVSSGVTSRFLSYNTVAAPPEPTPQRTIINGKVTTGTTLPIVGGGQRDFTISQNKEVLQSIYQLELDQAGHDCRHGGKNCK